MGKETSQRIQTSILNAAEKKVLVWLAKRQPAWVTSDMLTFLGVGGAVICALGFILANFNVMWLWLSSFGLVVNWYGDSLDGTLARVRNTQRPVYGFFIDHTLDAVTQCIMCVGAGLSPMFRLDVALLVLAGYLCLSVYTYILTILKGEFRLTYGGMGPTEFRLLLILLNIVYMYTPLQDIRIQMCGSSLNVFDIACAAVALLLFIVYIIQLAKDAPGFLAQDKEKGSRDA